VRKKAKKAGSLQKRLLMPNPRRKGSLKSELQREDCRVDYKSKGKLKGRVSLQRIEREVWKND